MGRVGGTFIGRTPQPNNTFDRIMGVRDFFHFTPSYTPILTGKRRLLELLPIYNII